MVDKANIIPVTSQNELGLHMTVVAERSKLNFDKMKISTANWTL
jgi:hypothetical protein